MDEIEYKLNTNNNILISSAISKLLGAIKKYDKEIKLQDCPEFKVLQESCLSSNPLLSITACHGMMILAEDGTLEFNYILSTIMSTATTTKFHTGVISALGKLMVMDMKMRINNSANRSYTNPFNVNSPQHPFITVLMKNKSAWNDILNQIEHICNSSDKEILKHSVEFLRPVLLYVLLNKTCDLEESNRLEVWRLLLKQLHQLNVQQIIMETFTWSNIESEKCHFISVLCIELMDRALLLENSHIYTSLTPYLISIIPNLLAHGFDPSPAILIVLRVLQKEEPLIGIDEILMTLAECIDVCPSVYLEDLILLCNAIVEKEPLSFIPAHTLVSSLLQWMAYSSCLTSSALKIAWKLIQRISGYKSWLNTSNQNQNKLFKSTNFYSGKLLKYSRLSEVSKTIWQNESMMDNWLDKLIQVENKQYLYEIRNFLFGIFISKQRNNVILKILKLLLAALNVNSKMAMGFLTLLLYKLSKETDVSVQIELLRALPQMAVVKETVPLVVNTLACLKKGPVSLQSLCIDLQMRLCRVEVRCYPYLQESLVENSNGKGDNWYKDILKAVAIRELALTRPEHHGSELVAHISHLLNRCGDPNGAVASSIATESILHLCRAGVVDVISTWKVLLPRLNKETRPRVIVSVCKLLAIFPSLCTGSKDYSSLLEEVINMLWNYIVNFNEKDIIDSALDALSNYSLEHMTLKQVPQIFRQNLKLPNSYCKTPQDAARKPEDVLPYIPGECWIQLLQNINQSCLDKAGDLIGSWINSEISEYRSGIYNTAKGEPTDYSNLQSKSVVKAIVEFVLSQATKSTYECPPLVLKQCLRILSKRYSKPLPPLNWCCLHDLYHREDLQNYCITIATRQMEISGSAKRFIDNYFSVFDAETCSEQEITNIYENLSYYCKTIAPNALRKIISSTLECVLDRALSNHNNEEVLFRKLLKHIKETLCDERIHDANRTLLAQLLEILLDKIHQDDDLFQDFAECCLDLPMIYFDRITSPTIWWETTPAKIRKATIIRCAMSTKSGNDEKALIWLNEIIDVGMSETNEQNYILCKIIPVIQKRHDKQFVSTNCEWCLELMGQTQAELVKAIDNKNMTLIYQNRVTFLCDVLMLTLECLSGAICLEASALDEFITSTSKFDLFPMSVGILCTYDDWTETMAQIIEWLYHMTSSSVMSDIYKSTFQKALMVSKIHKQFDQKSLWYKIIQENYCNDFLME